MTTLKKILLAGTAIACACGLSVAAAAQDASTAPAVVKSSAKMKLNLYGQISRVFGLISDGTNQQFRQAQNSNTSSRMGIEASGKIHEGWSLRTRFELELVGDTSLDFDQNNSGDREQFRIRYTDAAFSHKRLGAVSVGLGDTASNGTAEVSLLPGGATGHRGGTLHHMAEGVDVRDKDTGAHIDQVELWFSNLDGAGRATRIRYDSPVHSGIMASVSYIDGASWDAALRYSGTVEGTKVQGAVGFSMIRDGNDGFADIDARYENAFVEGSDRLSGSFSVRLPMGLGVTMSGAHEWRKRKPGWPSNIAKDAWNINPSLWYTMNAVALGPSTAEYSYQYSENPSMASTTASAHAITLYQVLESVGTDTFLTFRYYDLGEAQGLLGPPRSPRDVWVIGGGFRARF